MYWKCIIIITLPKCKTALRRNTRCTIQYKTQSSVVKATIWALLLLFYYAGFPHLKKIKHNIEEFQPIIFGKPVKHEVPTKEMIRLKLHYVSCVTNGTVRCFLGESFSLNTVFVNAVLLNWIYDTPMTSTRSFTRLIPLRKDVTR